MSADALRSILIAGVGNSWLRDDGFGGEVARRLLDVELPPGVTVMDAGTGLPPKSNGNSVAAA